LKVVEKRLNIFQESFGRRKASASVVATPACQTG